jgi:CTP:molybdopterin cytidylyltransferase MocA
VTGEVAVVIVAAGAGRRLGGAAKALLPAGNDDGATFLATIARSAGQAGAGRAVVVVGPPHGERVIEEARRLALDVTDNPDPDRGMASSVALGFEHAVRHFGGASSALLWPVDHARVAPATVALLVAGAAASPGRILVPTWRGRGGHPTAFGRELWPELAACAELPRGARSVLDRRADRVDRLPFDDPGVTADVDLPGDLR